MTAEQIVVRRVISQAGNTGVSFKSIRAQIPQDQIASTVLRKVVDNLEKSGLIKSFKNINVGDRFHYTCGLHLMSRPQR